jgi:hypothetical protein
VDTGVDPGVCALPGSRREARSTERLIGRVACVFEVVPALLVGKEGADVTDSFPEGIDGSRANAPEMGLELGECHFDGIEVRTVRRQEQEPGATLLEDSFGFLALGAIASAAGIYAFDVNPSLGPPPIITATPPLLPSPMPAPPPAPVIVEAPLVVPNAPVPPMTAEIWEVQERLEFLGMQPGSPDGIPGYRTFNAIRRYEELRGQADTGKLDRKLLEQLRGESK